VYSSQLAVDRSADPPLLRLATYGRSAFELVAETGPRLEVIANLAFGIVSVGSQASRTFGLFNVGSADVHVTSVARTAGSAAFTVVGPSAFTIPPGGQVDVQVQFAPTSYGPQTATFTVTSDDPQQPTINVPASGETPPAPPTPTATSTATPTSTATATATPTRTPAPTATATATSTPTPTATATATGTAPPTPTAIPTACGPRPSVNVAVQPGPPNTLQVSITAISSPVLPNNELRLLDFGAATNAQIDVGDGVVHTGNFRVNLPAGTQQTSFTVHHATLDQATTVPLVVVDRCGDWPTLVGGGPNAF